MWPPSTTKLDNVTLVLAVAPATLGAADRRETCLVSQQVLDDLSRTLHPVLGGYGQIRVIPDAANGRAAVFTIAGINGQAGYVVSVYPDSGASIGGATKLFTAPVPASLGNGRVMASPSSVVTRGQSGGVSQTLTVWPSASGGGFAETVTLGDGELILLAPHGGAIETGTSNQITYLVSKLATMCPQFGAPTIWHCEGNLTAANFDRLHITSTAIDERGFTGLDETWKAAPYQGPIRYRYSVALHGMSGSALVISIGGRVNQIEKDLVGAKIQSKFPSSAGLMITYEAVGIGGTSPNNFMNRLSENIPPSPSTPFRLGRGGIQIEQSLGVRTGTDPVSGKLYRDLVIDGLAEALTELLGRNRVYVRDHLADDGTLSAPPPSYMSPDVCIRLTPPSAAALADKSVGLENDEIPLGTAASVFVRAYNANPVVPLSDFHAHVYDSVPSTLVQPEMWNPLGSVTLGAVDSNTTAKVGSFVPPNVTIAGHRCMICIVADELYDLTVLKNHAVGWSITQFTDFIRRSRLAAWRNYQAVTVAGSSSLDVLIPGFDKENLEFRIEVGLQLADPGVEVAMLVPAELYAQLNIGQMGLESQIAEASFEKLVKVWLPHKPVIELGRGVLPSKARHACQFEVRVPTGTSKLGSIYIRQIYLPRGRPEVEVGRVTWELRRPKTKPQPRVPTAGTIEAGEIAKPKPKPKSAATTTRAVAKPTAKPARAKKTPAKKAPAKKAARKPSRTK